MEEKIFIQIRFKEKTSHGEYNDALYFTQEEYASIDKATIDAMKQQRVNNWIYALEHPPEYVTPTKEILEQMIAEKQQELQQIEQQKEELYPEAK